MKIAALLILFSGLSHAAEPYIPCGDTPEQGLCESPTKVIWCEEKQLKSLKCLNGTVCAWNDMILSFDCLEAACDGVPSTGQCTNENTVQWCHEGQTKTLHCPGDNVCGWNDSMGMYDCIKSGIAPTPAPSDAGFDSPDTSSTPLYSEDTESIPTSQPTQETLGDVSSPSNTSNGGCQNSPAGTNNAVWMMLLMLLALRTLRWLDASSPAIE